MASAMSRCFSLSRLLFCFDRRYSALARYSIFLGIQKLAPERLQASLAEESSMSSAISVLLQREYD